MTETVYVRLFLKLDFISVECFSYNYTSFLEIWTPDESDTIVVGTSGTTKVMLENQI